MKLTKEEAIRRHRMMWKWIANETLRRRRCVRDWEAFDHFRWDYYAAFEHEWCCEYAGRAAKADGEKIQTCRYCPIRWNIYSEHATCVNPPDHNVVYPLSGLLAYWSFAVNKEDWRTAAYYALYISMLPEKK